MSRLHTVLADPLWAITRPRLQQIIDAVASGAPRAAAPAKPLTPRRDGAVAVIPIHGEISYRASWLTDLFGGTSIDAVRAAFREAINAPDVTAVVLDIDSPGGTVPGNTELAAEIRAARGGGKPIIAVADALMASAAYWIGCQADEVWVTPSGQVGSIGIFAVHEDISGALEQEGVKVTIFRSADFKNEGNPYEPLTDEVREHLEARVTAMDRQFVADVAKGRGVSEQVVRESYGQGRVLLATEAAATGMVDGIATLETVIRAVAKTTRATTARVVRAEDGSPEMRASAAEPGEGAAVDDDPSERPPLPGERAPFPFRVRAQHLAEELAALVSHAQARADLRSKEGRPAFGPDTTASLRSIRDALTDLLPVDPTEAPAPAEAAAVEPPESEAHVDPAPPAPTPRRFEAPGAWDAFLRTQVGTAEH